MSSAKSEAVDLLRAMLNAPRGSGLPLQFVEAILRAAAEQQPAVQPAPPKPAPLVQSPARPTLGVRGNR